MDLVDSLEEMFQWQTPPFCYTPLNFLMGFEMAIPSLDAMLVDIELPEINMVYSEPVQSILPLSPSNSITTTTPVVNSAIEEASVSIRVDPSKLIHSSVQKGTRAFEIFAASNTPPVVVKPKRSRRSSEPTTSKGVVPMAKILKDPASTFKQFGAAELKSKGEEIRVPTKAEHIIRERQRRDDMAAKYATLESLLPPASKRERAAVVEDAISFVEALQQKKAQLQKKSADLKLKASCNQSPSWGKKTRSSAHLPQSLGTVDNPSPCIPKKQRSSASSNGINPILDRAATGPHASAISAINVHLGEGEIVVETVWKRPRSNFQSALLMAVESLGFEVTKCCILRVGNGYMQCVITCTKLQGLSLRQSELQSSSTMISRALRHMLTLAD